MHGIGQSAGKDFSYLLGVYLGDGCVTSPSTRSLPDKRCFKLNTIDQDFADTTKAALSNLTGRLVSISYRQVVGGRPQYQLYCGDSDLSAALERDTLKKTVIPEYVWMWPRENIMAFVIGLMDSEGFVGANGNPTNRRFYMGYKSCDPWVPDFIRLLQNIGIRIGKVQQEEPYKPGYKPATRFTVKMQSWIDSGCRFNIARKQKRVDEWAEAGPYERRARFPRRSTSEAIRSTV